MAKYDPLRRFLRRRRAGDILLTFAEIEQILGAMLPHAASDPLWWGNIVNTARGRSQSYAWLEAGYRANPCQPLNQVWFRQSNGKDDFSSTVTDKVALGIAAGPRGPIR